MKLGIPPEQVAADWEDWCGVTKWSIALRKFGELGGKIVWWSGYPQSKSAIPLCFSLFRPDGVEILCKSRLKDIRAAIETMIIFNAVDPITKELDKLGYTVEKTD